MQSNTISLQNPELEGFRLPEGAKTVSGDDVAQTADVTSVVSVASHTFTFQENGCGCRLM